MRRRLFQPADAARDTAARSGLLLDPMAERHERAADRVAEQVTGGGPQARQAGGAAIGRISPVPAGPRQHGGASGRVRQAIESARGGGQPVPEQVRDSVEPVVGADLGRVRLHADARADELTRLLGARAFTTGSEIFLRQGEYRPGSGSGRRLLAHELTHVAQQADGAAPAAALQRIKIDGLDTDVEKELAELVWRIRIMDATEVATMRRAIRKELAGREADSKVASLLEALDTRDRTLERRRAAREQHAEPEARIPRRAAREPSPPPVRERPPRGLASPDPAETKAEAPHPAIEGLTTRATSLTRRIAELLASGDALAHRRGTETTGWLREADTWLSDVSAFLPGYDTWSDEFGNLPPSLRRPHRPALATPLQTEIEKLSKRQSELAKQHKEAQSRLQPQQPVDSSEAIGSRIADVKRGGRLVKLYGPNLEFALPDSAPKKWKWGDTEQAIPAVLLEWLFIAMLGKVDRDRRNSRSSWVGTLLGKLMDANRSGNSLWVTVVGDTHKRGPAHGIARPNWITLHVNLLSVDLEKLLTSDDAGSEAARVSLVASMASTFVHEYAHVRQMQVYDNSSYPWKPHKDFGGFNLGMLSSKGVPEVQWTQDVRSAYAEFKNGGQSAQASADEHWKNFSSALERYEYLDADQKLHDDRGGELVSHLMELSYAWNDDDRFKRIFPECARLLDRVITHGGAAPGT